MACSGTALLTYFKGLMNAYPGWKLGNFNVSRVKTRKFWRLQGENNGIVSSPGWKQGNFVVCKAKTGNSDVPPKRWSLPPNSPYVVSSYMKTNIDIFEICSVPCETKFADGPTDRLTRRPHYAFILSTSLSGRMKLLQYFAFLSH
jgi:hypothetical protein